jgi:hypothetical protein
VYGLTQVPFTVTSRWFEGACNIHSYAPLLATDYEWNLEAAAALVSSRLIGLLPGHPWKSKVR